MSNNRKEPVKHTCPDIDNIISVLDASRKSLDHLQKNNDEISSELSDIEWNLRLDGDLEDLRSSNGALRDWGNELVSECEDFENQIYQKDELISELESKVSELENIISELEYELKEVKNDK